jgi:glucosamine-6-phosphate deaminase
MWHHFFSHVNVRPENVHILNGNAPDLELECANYEAAITAAGGINLFLAGIGADGHIAFNEPGSSLSSRTRVKTLAYDTILDNSRFFDNDISQDPKMALTVGVQTVLNAKEVVAIALGARKAVALQKCIEGGVNHMWTLSALQLHRHSMIVVDEDATQELQVKTVKVRFGGNLLPTRADYWWCSTSNRSKSWPEIMALSNRSRGSFSRVTAVTPS